MSLDRNRLLMGLLFAAFLVLTIQFVVGHLVFPHKDHGEEDSGVISIAAPVYVPGHPALWLAEQDGSLAGLIEQGERLFGQCRGCHNAAAGAPNKQGPNLWAIVGQASQAAEGFSYSGALAAATEVWSLAALDEFIYQPRRYAPGTSMGYNGLRNPDDRAALLAYLRSLDDGELVPLSEPSAADLAAYRGEAPEGDTNSEMSQQSEDGTVEADGESGAQSIEVQEANTGQTSSD